MLGSYEKALDDFEQAIMLDPTKDLCYNNRASNHLYLNNLFQARVDYAYAGKLSPASLLAPWSVVWIDLCMHNNRPTQYDTTQLEQIAAKKPRGYYTYMSKALALSLRNKLKQALSTIKDAIHEEHSEYDAYFWKGMLIAYFYHGSSHYADAEKLVRQALDYDMPPILLKPLYWLEKDNPQSFAAWAKPLLDEYKI